MHAAYCLILSATINVERKNFFLVGLNIYGNTNWCFVQKIST